MRKLLLLITLLFLLVGCASKEEKIITKSQEKHEQLSYVKVNAIQTSDSVESKLREYVDFEYDKMESYNKVRNSISFKDGEDFYVLEPSGFLSFPENKKGTMRESLKRKERLYRQPFKFFEAYDEDFLQHLTIEDEGTYYTLQYKPKNETIRDEFYKGYILDFLIAARDANNESDEVEKMNFDVNTFDVIFEVDVDTNYITRIKTVEDATLELNGQTLEMKNETVYLFSDFDKEHKINIPPEAINITQ